MSKKVEHKGPNEIMQQIAKQYQDIFNQVDQFKEHFGDKLVDQIYRMQNEIKQTLPEFSSANQKESLEGIQHQHWDGMKVALDTFVKETSSKIYEIEKQLHELRQPLEQHKEQHHTQTNAQEPGWSDFTNIPEKKPLPQKNHRNLQQNGQKKINKLKF